MLTVKIEGLDDVKARIGGLAKQADFAASRALNTMAKSVTAGVYSEMRSVLDKPTPFALRSMRTEWASKANLSASVGLRTDAPDGGTSYFKALHHLFSGGTRDWKRMEGALLGLGVVPKGMMVVPGAACPLDSRGNMRRAAMVELLGVLRSSVRNLRVVRRAGKTSKQQKAVGYFVIRPGDKSHLHPGIWKRIETGSSSTVKPIIMFVHPGKWRRYIDLQSIGEKVVARDFNSAFDTELRRAISSAR